MKNWILRLVLSAVLISSLLPTHSNAQTTAVGITVTPITDEFTIKPGATVMRKLRVINPSANTLTLYPLVLNFTTDNDKGQPTFYDETERSTTYGLSNWVSFSKDLLRIAPGEEELFDVTVSAPENAEPGGHYGSVLFSTEKPQTEGNLSQISVVGLVGTLLLARVPGQIDENLELEEFTAPTLLFAAPAQFSTLFRNEGNVHVKPIGELKIRNWSGAVVQTIAINKDGGNVLPLSRRRFVNQWNFDWKAVGKYTANAVVTYGSPEQQINVTRTFIILPYWLLVTIGVLLLALIIWLRRRRWNKPDPSLPTLRSQKNEKPKQPPRVMS